MNQPLQSMLQHLFQVSSLDDLSRQQLESFVEQHPSFGIGHYLLSQKLRTEDPDRYKEATQRTALYFSNPFWLLWQLDNYGAPTPATRVESASPETVPATLPETLTDTLPVTIEEPAADATAITIPATMEETSADALPATTEEPTADALPATTEESSADALPATIEEPTAEVSAADRLLLSIEEAKGLRESLQRINEDFTAAPVLQEYPIHDQEAPFVLDEPVEAHGPATEASTDTAAEATAGTAAPEPTPEVTAEQPSETTTDPITEATTQSATSSEPSPAAPTAPAPAGSTPDLVFEPYHTIDYFASQGIRLKLDENPGDALGKQLKSFTDWLKVMRRLPQKDRESSVPDRVAEQAVQDFAAHSIQSKDVVTETMAEVLIKQGMRDRARVIYEKLSLLNPDKKAYFAAKIEQLNIP